MTAETMDHGPWPRRAVYLLLLGAILGLAFDALIDGPDYAWTTDVLRLSAAFAILVGGIVFALTLERLRWLWSLAFAVVAGLVIGAVFYWNGSPEGWRAGEQWQLVAALLAIFIAAPLFQSARDAGRWRTDYKPIHGYAWGNLVLWGAAWVFVLIVYLLSQLMAELFSLIGIKLLREALRESWFRYMLIGAALGAAFGMLRDRDKIVDVLQRVGMTILSVLTPILAIGLLLFVLALPFTGLEPLWEQTKSTTPILLACVIGAVILLNAVIGNGSEEESKQPLLRYSAMALGAVILPLAIVATVSTWLRIDQYGFTPERLWGVVFVAVCVAVALAYFVSLIRGRLGWAEHVRRANIALAIGICAGALLLATPLVNFGALSARDQVARLKSGKVAPEKFDWQALAFDFGPAGRKALEQLKKEGPSAIIRAEAARALASKSRWPEVAPPPPRDALDWGRLRVVPQPVAIPAELRIVLSRNFHCRTGDSVCVLYYRPGEAYAAAISSTRCGEVRGHASGCSPSIYHFRREGAIWAQFDPVSVDARAYEEQGQVMDQALRRGEVEFREVKKRQLFIGGQPAGPAFE